jgi:DNA-binding NarL/FixJ family response regulator
LVLLSDEGDYVTPKTVEVHLSNAYRKLSIASRRELPAALAS